MPSDPFGVDLSLERFSVWPSQGIGFRGSGSLKSHHGMAMCLGFRLKGFGSKWRGFSLYREHWHHLRCRPAFWGFEGCAVGGLHPRP